MDQVLLPRVLQIMGTAIAQDAPDLPGRLCHALSDALESGGAALALMADLTHHHTLVATDPQAAALAQLEFLLSEGPGLDAVAHGRPALVGDLSAPGAERWPVWAATVAGRDLPTRAVFAFPLQVNGSTFGLVELYRDRPGLLDEREAATARLAADLTALALAHSFGERVSLLPDPTRSAVAPDAAEPNGVDVGGADCVDVDQAVGMVMAQLRAPAETAVSVLRARASAEGRTLGEVARDVLARKISFKAGEP